ncbi:bifunctional sugar-1-phosphate nucleotidylyltransferase/acetyltransferase [Halorubellus sp. PRR65]|uniref:bifunctional sugar-1-phosphate nucleotidylyltransferase/acetyltransferase n=1 Tax=Halorubellus sp. PRR65 TaxID=3098148 RepID=UPI002B25DE6D|nr:bifunctional sugar-1-phosphate nucleotidylyltransferase/acetyltransferase [Halorubellus sp. PRR65]
MKAVVVAAGEGTRMRPLTHSRPKPMLPVAGTPMVERVLDACAPYVDGFVVIVGYEADAIREHFGGEHAGVGVEYVEQGEQLGTAHAIGRAADVVDEPFVALNGDVVVDDALVAALAAAAADGESAIATMHVDDPRNYGVVDVADGYATGIVEKPPEPPSTLANLGLYAFDPSVFAFIEETGLSERGEYEITETIERMLAAGKDFRVVEHDGDWLDVGRPWELLDAQEVLFADLERDVQGVVEDGATVEGPVVVEDGATVRTGSVVEGPVVVKAGASVGPNAYVRGSTVLMPGATAGTSVEVKNSILMADATVPHLSYVGDSVLGRDVNLGAGTQVANLRHDDENVRMGVKGDRVDTGRRKLGVVAADGVKTGINASLNAGVKLGVGATTTPGESVTRDRGENL